jgi:predicted RNA binding protein YcfA (HicA-like mRNA interferase family)
MKPVSGRRLCKVLEDRGWTRIRINGSHYIFARPGQSNVSIPVHGNRDLKPGAQNGITRQAGLTDADL